MRRAFVLLGALLLSACAARREPAPTSVPPPPVQAPASAVDAGVVPGPDLATVDLGPRGAAPALAAFRRSCPALTTRADGSGLTRPEDWRPACAAAATASDPAAFFAGRFEAVRIGDGQLFATGYYEPEIAASPVPAPSLDAPVLGPPDDLIEADLGLWSEALKGRRVRGRVADGRLIPYHDRAAIEAGALGAHAPVLAWADRIDLFFLQIQGSGRLRMPDGTILRVGYAGQNGRDYLAIGRLLRERGLVQPPVTMQAIVAWLRAHPDEGRAVMRENRSYVFFRRLIGDGPLGALGVPVTPAASLAADPAFVPLGAPVLLRADTAAASGLWVAQDTGGAIKGANRVDTFWGAGAEAAATAGALSTRGEMWVLLPRARAGGRAGAATP